MKKELIVTSTQGMSKENWLKFRKRGIGASEVGVVMGYSQYKSPVELFHERLSLAPEMSLENIAMFMGHYHEDAVADLWQYWDGSQDGMMANYAKGNVIRRCRKINAYIQNPKYPWLFVSLDRIINKGSRGEEGALEIKTIASYEADKWEAGIPTPHIMQVHTQMLCCDFTFGEIAAMKDGRYFDVYPFDENQIIFDAIIHKTKEFWDKVEQGRMFTTRKYEAVLNHNMRLANECQAEIDRIEPQPDGSEAYERFMKDRFKKSIAEAGLIVGTSEDYIDAKEYLRICDDIKALEVKKLERSNRLRNRIKDKTKIDFGRNGYVSWSGNPRRFSVKVK